jgi:hypothetical protein
LDRKLEFPANNSNDDNTPEDNSSIGSDPIGAEDPHKKKRNRKSKKVVVQQATYQMKELGGLVFNKIQEFEQQMDSRGGSIAQLRSINHENGYSGI